MLLIVQQILKMNPSMIANPVKGNSPILDQVDEKLARHAQKVCSSLGRKGFIFRDKVYGPALLNELDHMLQEIDQRLWQRQRNSIYPR